MSSPPRVVVGKSIPSTVISSIADRTTALWVALAEVDSSFREEAVSAARLPWKLVVSEILDAQFYAQLEEAAPPGDWLVRQRGYVYVVDDDPSRFSPPARYLPVYALQGRSKSAVPRRGLSDTRRRLNILADVESGPDQLVVVLGNSTALPQELIDLFADGYRASLTIVADPAVDDRDLEAACALIAGATPIQTVKLRSTDFFSRLVTAYSDAYSDQALFFKVKRSSTADEFHTVDASGCDEPQKPLLLNYEPVAAHSTSPILPSQLSRSDVVAFFDGESTDWKANAAGLPWMRTKQWSFSLQAALRRIHGAGSERNRIVYLAAQPGAGATTTLRHLAWEAASAGYPTLVAREIPFEVDGQALVRFFDRFDEAVPQEEKGEQFATPWLIVFDRQHWGNRYTDLLTVFRILRRAARPACILIATDIQLDWILYRNTEFEQLGEIRHEIDSEECVRLGLHLGRFAAQLGTTRSPEEWETYRLHHSVRYVETDLATFWIGLSFWLRNAYDLSESIQSWLVRIFVSEIESRDLRQAVLEIAAMSAEGLPLPEYLLPSVSSDWPTGALLLDRQSRLSGLGLRRVVVDGVKYWMLAHDILGTLLLSGIFHDFSLLTELGYKTSVDPIDFKFRILREISRKPELGEDEFRPLGVEFATNVFKIDPDKGRGEFVILWREVLAALDDMPRALWLSSRPFRHHAAISRRRIVSLNEHVTEITPSEKVELLERAVIDVRYAIEFIKFAPGAETDLNLYNSLARCYLDLASAERDLGADQERIDELRRLARDATASAYALDPANPYVVETYVSDLLQEAQIDKERSAENCVRALGVLFESLANGRYEERRKQLSALASESLRLLLQSSVAMVQLRSKSANLSTAVDVLVGAWLALYGDGPTALDELSIEQVDVEKRRAALRILSHSAGAGSPQVVSLRYQLYALEHPYDYAKQMELLSTLDGLSAHMSPQMQLELAVLQYQLGRNAEGENLFRGLRRLWKRTDTFVAVPDHLRWLRSTTDPNELEIVHATISSDDGLRAKARVAGFGSQNVPFRPSEMGLDGARPGQRFVAKVSFGHNGPFLRNVTAGQNR